MFYMWEDELMPIYKTDNIYNGYGAVYLVVESINKKEALIKFRKHSRWVSLDNIEEMDCSEVNEFSLII